MDTLFVVEMCYYCIIIIITQNYDLEFTQEDTMCIADIINILFLIIQTGYFVLFDKNINSWRLSTLPLRYLKKAVSFTTVEGCNLGKRERR
jgi:hypothetical protein